MTLVPRDPSPAPRGKVALNRTRRDTTVWALRVAVTPRPRTRRTAEHAAESRRMRVTLTRTPRDTLRWVMKSTPWGAVIIAAAVLITVGAAVGLWLLVPVIDAAVGFGMAAASDFLNWAIDAIAGFPVWLGSLF